MKFLLLLLFPCILLAEPEIIEAEEKHPIEIELDKAFDKDHSTAGMVLALGKAQEQWLKELEKNYQQLLEKLEPEASKSLREAQSLWVKQRDKEVDFLIAFYSKTPGTMYRIIYAERMMAIVQERAEHLSYLVECLDVRTK